MPPPGSPPPPSKVGQNGPRITEPYYSNRDIGVLHDIVILAQELLPRLPERERLPTNALFSAYDDILPRIGIDVDHDSRYARVLFKIGGLRGPGTLYEKFEEILSRMGIEIEFDSQDGDEDTQAEDSQNKPESSNSGDISFTDEGKVPTGQERRNSEASAKDHGGSVNFEQETRRNSHSPGDRAHETFDLNALLQQVRPHPLHAAKPTNGAQKEEIAVPDVRAWLDSRQESPRSKTRGRSISAHGSMRIRRRSTSRGRPPSPAFTSNDHEEPDDFTADSIHAMDDYVEEQEDPVNGHREDIVAPAPESLMQIKASVILQDHLRFLAKQQLRLWKEKALQQHEDNEALNALAEHNYRRILSKAVLGIWRPQASERRKIRTTENFFAHLEERATKAREVYLLHIAFVHWSSFALEQAHRTALARRHIIRKRIFNAWRDITAVNELKVRRQVLKKFFGIWKHQRADLAENDAFAVQKYESDAAEKVFISWLHRLREVKADAWWAQGIKRRTLFHWIVASHEVWENHRTAEEARLHRLRWNAWSIWKSKTRTRIQQDAEADFHYQDNLRLSFLRKWRKETDVIPAKTIVQTDVAGRLLRDTFGTWVQRTRHEKMAESVDQMRILREALTRWRHQARFKQMSYYINDRLRSEGLYKFYTATRASVAVRERNERQTRQVIQVWVYRTQQSMKQRWEQEDVAHSFAVKRSQNLALAHWYSQMESRKRLEVLASEFHEPLLLRGILTKWSVASQHQQQLQKWAKDAEYYLLATKFIKRWKASTEAAQREKRKTAYIDVRRMIKHNLVRGVLQKWRRQAQYILDLQAQANEVKHNRNVILGMEIFDRWRGRAEELGELESLAQETVLIKHFTIWREKSEGLHALQTEATIAYQERRQSRAVKKWSLTLLQLRAQSNYASDVCEKNAKKTFRKMFNYWHQKALQRRPLQRISASESDQLLGTTARAETWSDYGGEGEIDEWAKGLDEATTSTPIPGYLATPSRVNRTGRVIAAAARFSTTPKAPLSTPFERQLRAQYSGGQFPSLRKGLARSTLGLGGGFADIPEHSKSMNNDRGSRG